MKSTRSSPPPLERSVSSIPEPHHKARAGSSTLRWQAARALARQEVSQRRATTTGTDERSAPPPTRCAFEQVRNNRTTSQRRPDAALRAAATAPTVRNLLPPPPPPNAPGDVPAPHGSAADPIDLTGRRIPLFPPMLRTGRQLGNTSLYSDDFTAPDEFKRVGRADAHPHPIRAMATIWHKSRSGKQALAGYRKAGLVILGRKYEWHIDGAKTWYIAVSPNFVEHFWSR